jgi:wyosine [tRNA(Phe)-imidazoG37] synthetase (radical SAM superfamily)
MFADYVSLKIDTLNESTWEKINRPHVRLRFDVILKGISDFAESFKGKLTTETMLIKDYNDNLAEIDEIGKYLATLKRDSSYFMIPVRPPSEKYAVAPGSEILENISSFVKMKIPKAEMMCCPEMGDFNTAGNIEEELLSIMAVHPMKEGAISSLIKRNGGNPNKIKEMVNKGLIQLITYNHEIFYKTAI